MSECHGFWSSWINPSSDFPVPEPPSDGTLFVDQEDSQGNFTGSHVPSFDKLNGNCIPPVNLPHRIIILRIHPGQILHYDGDITPDPSTGALVARGRRYTLGMEDRRFKLADDDEVWIAVKTT